MRRSAEATIQDYLNQAVNRLELEEVDENDFKKVLEHIEKAEEEIQKELDNE